ncbi:MAG TPA: ABC transporter permease [Bacteroidales bacterium]|nr:ABC transporter permease [Bacteroidales bacterium]HPS49480.1 ABC transporter permease [Bacteroidales bacterium]
MNDLMFIFRILKRNPLSFFVNVIGLSVALTTVIFTLTYIRYELSFDRHFKTKDRVVRLYSRVTDNTSTQVYGISLRSAYSQLPEMVPEVEAAVQLYGGWPASVQTKETKAEKVGIFYADPEFFKVFGLGLRLGDEKTALVGAKNAVITSSVAEKLFHSTNCIGKSVEADGEQVVITGVMDEIPKNSHLNFGILISIPTLDMRWLSSSLEFQTYYLLKPNTDFKAASEKIAAANNRLMKDWASNWHAKIQSGVEPLTDLYLYSEAGSFIPIHGSTKQIVIVGLIALFVLLTALVSYINLFIIQGEKRIVEISTRTMFGATKASIARLFFLETLIVFLFSAVLAFLIIYIEMPYLSNLLQSKVDLSDLLSFGGILSVMIVLMVLIVVTSGYPVLYLSRMKYALGLRGKISGSGNSNWLSIASVFVQFMVASFFISCVVIIIAQLSFMHRVPLGFDKYNVITISNCSTPISKKYESIKTELLKLPFVTAVCGGEHFMGGGCSGQVIRNVTDAENSNKAINEYREKPGFGELMNFKLIDGRFFRQSMADSQAVVLNESAVKLLGLSPKAGQTIIYRDERVEIIGVVKDFYYESNPGEAIEPLVIANCFWGTPNIYIRSNSPLTESQLKQIKTVFHYFDNNYIFNHSTLADIFDGMYKKENRLAQMVFIGGTEVVIISLLSLLALTILKISRRTKEIGIRKVNGSTVLELVSGLLKETIIMVAGAILVASLAGYLVMDRWLSDYAARIHLTPGYFLLSALFVFIIAFVATIWQAWRAATSNPVEALKYE